MGSVLHLQRLVESVTIRKPRGPRLPWSAQWIHFTMIAPGGEERHYRRTITDQVEPGARESGNVEITTIDIGRHETVTCTQRTALVLGI